MLRIALSDLVNSDKYELMQVLVDDHNAFVVV